MSTSTNKQAVPAAAKAPAPKPAAAPKPDIEAASFQLIYLDDDMAEQTIGADEGSEATQIGPPRWFAVQVSAPIEKRYLHLIQISTEQDHPNGIVILALADRQAAGADDLRLPRDGSWLRAIVMGTVHVWAADEPLSRKEIEEHRGGHEPPPAQTRPPYT